MVAIRRFAYASIGMRPRSHTNQHAYVKSATRLVERKMTEFEEALAEYRAALEAASATATTDIELRIYRLYSNDLAHTERLYHKSGDAKWCLPLLESARLLHQTDVLAGKEFLVLRAVFDRLLECCRRSLRDFQ